MTSPSRWRDFLDLLASLLSGMVLPLAAVFLGWAVGRFIGMVL